MNTDIGGHTFIGPLDVTVETLTLSTGPTDRRLITMVSIGVQKEII